MIKSVKEIVDKIPTVQTSDFLMIKKDRLEVILKEWGESIVDECSSNFECEIENVGNINGEGLHEDAFTAVLVRSSVLAVKKMIK